MNQIYDNTMKKDEFCQKYQSLHISREELETVWNVLNSVVKEKLSPKIEKNDPNVFISHLEFFK